MPRPEGGGGLGYGEKFQLDEATGVARFSVPLSLPQARALTPELSLSYASGNGNSLFGYGFALDLPAISRRTSLGVPRYDGRDQFVDDAGDVLVPRYDEGPSGWRIARRQETRGGTAYHVTAFRRRIESQFDRIEQWVAETDGTSFWQITDSDNVTSVYGNDTTARIADPAHPERIFRWMLQEQFDAKGNRAVFTYTSDDEAGVASLYPVAISYGNFNDPTTNTEAFAFTLLFDYDADGTGGTSVPVPRPDRYVSFRPGFELAVARLCSGLRLTHYFPQELGPYPVPVGSMRLRHETRHGLSLLTEIARIGHRRDDKGQVTDKALPPITFDYTAWTPEAAFFERLDPNNARPIPGPIAAPDLRLVDLYGDGVPGVLETRREGGANYYWRPRGQGTYDPAEPLPSAPVTPLDAPGRAALLDLSGLGQLDAVMLAPGQAGYYGNNNTGSWQPFQSFAGATLEIDNAVGRFVDLSGGGRADFLHAGSDTWRVSDALGRLGFARARTLPAPSGIERYDSDDEAIFIGFADIFGDGLSHLVRIASGSIRVWPSLGHGMFAPPRDIPGLPVFEQSVTASDIIFGNVTGTGGTDLFVVLADRVEIYRNAFGHAFSLLRNVPLPADYSRLGSAEAADLLGLGTAQFVVSQVLTAPRHAYLDLSLGQRPFLLSRIDNGMGHVTEIAYRSSADYALKDRAAGVPWQTQLPFAVSVVAEVRQIDRISRTTRTQVMQYRDGYFDPVDRQFAGFAYTQSQDHLALDPKLWHFPATTAGDDVAGPAIQIDPGVEPLLSKTWQHVGDYLQSEALRAQLIADSFLGDPDPFVLPPPYFSPTVRAADAETRWLAFKALAGRRIRGESYGVAPDGATKDVPYNVSQSAYGVDLVQPACDGHSAVVLVTERETAGTDYEQTADDPHTIHHVNTAFDLFGNEIRTLEIGYPRKPASGRTILPDQDHAKLRLQTSGLINHVDGAYRNADGGTTTPIDTSDGASFHLVGAVFEAQAFELSGFPAPAPYYSYDQAAEIAATCLKHVVAFGDPFTSGPEARLYHWSQSLYWKEDLSGAAPLQETGAQHLEYRQQQAVFSDSFVKTYYGTRVDTKYLTDVAGYQHADGYCWAPGETAHYSPANRFYIPTTYVDPFGAETTLRYDIYALNLTRKTDALGFSTNAVFDYQALLPCRVVDENGNTNEYGFDPLAQLVVQSVFGSQGGSTVGDDPLSSYTPVAAASPEDVLASPQKYLQNAGTYFYYDLEAWLRTPQLPVLTIEVTRRQFAHRPDGQPPDPNDIQITLRYFDGSIRGLARADLVSGKAPFALTGKTAPQLSAQPSGSPVNWLIKDQLRYDNRGNPIVRYQPYFADVPAYAAEPAAPYWNIVYDALYREIGTETPKGFLTANQYGSWWSRRWDEDDTVLQSPYYIAHINDPKLPAAEKAALEMATAFADTPLCTEIDVFGREIQQIRSLVQSGHTKAGAGAQLLKNYTWLDALDQVSAFADARFYNDANPREPAFYNYFVVYDMRGRTAWQKSADSGNQPLNAPADGIPAIRLYDASDQILDEWDRRGFRHSARYNPLRLPTGTVITGNGLDALAERIVYGTDPTTNTVNRIVEHDDQAGVETTSLYSIRSEIIHQTRQFRVAYEGVADWETPASVPLQSTVWSWMLGYNAVAEPISLTAPNDALLATDYTLNGWPCCATLITTSQPATAETICEVTRFSPAGRPAELRLGNQVVVTKTFDPKNYRLHRIEAVDGGGAVRQDLTYTFDPVGNVTNLGNGVPIESLATGTPAPLANSEYRYDSLYRLQSATGRRETAPSAPGALDLQAYLRQYHFDASGNLAAIDDDGGPSHSQTYAISPSADHGVTQQMATGHAPDDFFDADGLMTELPGGASLAHDYAGRLSTVSNGVGGDSHFQYASNGNRLRKAVVATTGAGTPADTYYLGSFISSGDKGSAASLVISLGDRMIAIAEFPASQPKAPATAKPALRYQLEDRIQSVAIELDQSADLLDAQEFYPFGETAIYVSPANIERTDKRYQFTGQEADASTGLYSFEKRYYSPVLARWIAPDPAGTVDGPNLFAYVSGNPLTLTDPTGENGNGEEGGGSSSGSNRSHVQTTAALAAAGILTPLDAVKVRLQMKKAAKMSAKHGVFMNALGEFTLGLFHHPITSISNPLSAALAIKATNFAGFGAVWGGALGVGVYAHDVRTKGANFYNVTSLVGSGAFLLEGAMIYRTLWITAERALHSAHRRIGGVAAGADLLKIPYAIKQGDWATSFLYFGLAGANIRSAISMEAAHGFYRGLFRAITAPYSWTKMAQTKPITEAVVSNAARGAAKAPPAAYIAIAVGGYSFLKKYFSPSEGKY